MKELLTIAAAFSWCSLFYWWKPWQVLAELPPVRAREAVAVYTLLVSVAALALLLIK